MRDASDSTSNITDAMPLGLVEINDSGIIESVNQYAQNLGIQPGIALSALIHVDSEQDFQTVISARALEAQIQLVSDIGTHHIQITRHAQNLFFIQDNSEQVAISGQLQKSKEPARKFLHDISNAFTTVMGYSELISMMLDENESLFGEQLDSVKRYEREVLLGLKKVDDLIKEYREGKSSTNMVPLNRRHLMIVDDEPSITEFLSELMRARHYKVTAFNSSKEALQFYKEQSKNVDLVIMDQIMPEMNGINLATELLAYNTDLPIVLCTGDNRLISDQQSGKVKIEHFISKPIDISELTQMVSAIID